MKKISTLTELKETIANTSNRLCIIDCYADWCGPCQNCEPVFLNFSQKYTDVDFFRVDIDSSPEIEKELNIIAMPTFKFFFNSSEVAQVVGEKMSEVEDVIKKYSKVGKDDMELSEDELLAKALEMSKQQVIEEVPKEPMDEVKKEDEKKEEIKEEKKEEKKGPKKLDISPEDALAMCKAMVNAEMLKELIDAGIKELHAVKALVQTGSKSTETAVKWYVDHSEDKDIDDDIEIMDGPVESTESAEEKKKKIALGIEETKKLIEEKKRMKEEAEKRERIEAEKKRREMGKKTIQSNEEFKKMAAQRERDEIKRQKIEDAKRKKQLQEQLEKDKERRRLERGGAKIEEEPKKVEVKKEEPKKVEVKKEEPKKVEVKKVEPKKVEVKKEEPKKVEVKKEEPKKEEPKKEEGPKKEYTECTIQVRLLDGSTVTQTFKANETIGHVKTYAAMLMKDYDFNLYTPFPRKIYKDLQIPLKEAGLVPRGQLICTRGD